MIAWIIWAMVGLLVLAVRGKKRFLAFLLRTALYVLIVVLANSAGVPLAGVIVILLLGAAEVIYILK